MGLTIQTLFIRRQSKFGDNKIKKKIMSSVKTENAYRTCIS